MRCHCLLLCRGEAVIRLHFPQTLPTMIAITREKHTCAMRVLKLSQLRARLYVALQS